MWQLLNELCYSKPFNNSVNFDRSGLSSPSVIFNNIPCKKLSDDAKMLS